MKKLLLLSVLICLAGNAWSYEVVFKEKPAKLEAKKVMSFVFNVGTADLKEIAGRKMHLVMVDKDLEMMFHFSPDADVAGNFTQEIMFPEESRYHLYFYFQPAGSPPIIKSMIMDVGKMINKFGTVRMYLENQKKTADGSVVCLLTDPEELKEQVETMITFVFADTKSAKPLKSIQPLADSGAQLVVINSNKDVYLQLQSEERSLPAYGPELHFKMKFPRKGVYKVWLEYKTKKGMNGIPFTLQVK